MKRIKAIKAWAVVDKKGMIFYDAFQIYSKRDFAVAIAQQYNRHISKTYENKPFKAIAVIITPLRRKEVK